MPGLLRKLARALLILVVAIAVVIFLLFLYVNLWSDQSYEPTADEGKPCNDSSECMGWCYAEGGEYSSSNVTNMNGTCGAMAYNVPGCHCYLTRVSNPDDPKNYQ